ncbi:hypothetical protein RvY_11735 [Ramazzottius varieornatus]|uniref:limulus clotting factor C n=1 Tax=Ramazzottius varieornatus TaxID=947166 RepID=A0A1D1VH26_RAMVA|nr:hypothetical protein RvY_11735 [Ramazzottius varieornatus]
MHIRIPVSEGILLLLLSCSICVGDSSHSHLSNTDTGTHHNRKYSPWTKWSQCSSPKSCEQKRFRSCVLTDEAECPHGPLHIQTRPCHEKRRCHQPGLRRLWTAHAIDDLFEPSTILEEFFYTNWSPWTRCHPPDCAQYRKKSCTFYPICGSRLLIQQRMCQPDACETERTSGSRAGSSTEKPWRPPAPDSDSDDRDETVGRSKDISPLGNISCGARKVPAAPSGIALKIFGGKASTAGHWPWQVSILNTQMDNYCAGTLISNWVVTAAHCVRRKMYIRVGEHHLYTEEETEQLFRPVKTVIHAHFDTDTIENDIALIKISSSIRYDNHVQPACLPNASEDDDLMLNTTRCVILGWGKRRPYARYGADVLHEAEVSVVSHSTCRAAYYHEHPITRKMICAGSGRQGRSDTCEGDSGGPLLCQLSGQENGEGQDAASWKIFGITSFGDSCGKRDKYGVYTRVSSYLDWISTVIKNEA